MTKIYNTANFGTFMSYMLPNIQVLSQGFFSINTSSHICCDKGKNVDNMQKVRKQHHNSICESMISRPDD